MRYSTLFYHCAQRRKPTPRISHRWILDQARCLNQGPRRPSPTAPYFEVRVMGQSNMPQKMTKMTKSDFFGLDRDDNDQGSQNYVWTRSTKSDSPYFAERVYYQNVYSNGEPAMNCEPLSCNSCTTHIQGTLCRMQGQCSLGSVVLYSTVVII